MMYVSISMSCELRPIQLRKTIGQCMVDIMDDYVKQRGTQHGEHASMTQVGAHIEIDGLEYDTYRIYPVDETKGGYVLITSRYPSHALGFTYFDTLKELETSAWDHWMKDVDTLSAFVNLTTGEGFRDVA